MEIIQENSEIRKIFHKEEPSDLLNVNRKSVSKLKQNICYSETKELLLLSKDLVRIAELSAKNKVMQRRFSEEPLSFRKAYGKDTGRKSRRKLL